jgi:hypothetical protein
MKKISKKANCLFPILFSFWFLIFPAYLHFLHFNHLDSASPGKHFKKIHEEDTSLIFERKEKNLGSTLFVKHLFGIAAVFERVPSYLLQVPPSDSISLILRC